MADPLTREPEMPAPLTACPQCGAQAFEDGRRSGLSKEIYCRGCHAGFRVNVHHDGLFLVERIKARPRRQSEQPFGHRRRQSDA
ncbi:MAG TPA: hypothetical protein VKQ73_06725 [Stellaceae bacterium]|nr:hypothetical protein [Stellaceae bacterium]